MAGTYSRSTDVLVIGAGPGGYSAAIRLGQLGRKVLLAERSEIGGECLNRGCIPSKALLHSSHLLATLATQKEELGFEGEIPHIDMARLQARKRSIVEKERTGLRGLIKSAGAETLPGEVRFTGPHTAEIVAADGGRERIDFQSAVIATGALHSVIPGFEPDGQKVVNAAQVLELTVLPRTLLVLGGGVSGCELGQFCAEAGVKVTIVELMPTLLPGLEPDLASELTRAFESRGIGVRTGTRATSLERGPEGLRLSVTNDQGSETLQAEQLFVTVGKRADTLNLGCAEAGIELEPKTGFVRVDAQQRTNLPHIYAVGDACRPPMLAHKAYREGMVAAEAIAGRPTRFQPTAIPSVVFTVPELATVGLSRAEAERAGHKVREAKFPFVALGRAHASQATTGWVKLVAEDPSGVLLGMHAAGEGSGEFVTEAGLALEMGATVRDLADTIHPHPTFSEALGEAALLWLGEPLHVAARRRPA